MDLDAVANSTAVDRARYLTHQFNRETAGTDYWQREELYETSFAVTVGRFGLDMGAGYQLIVPTNNDYGWAWELVTPETKQVCAVLMLRWESEPFATLLLDAGPVGT